MLDFDGDGKIAKAEMETVLKELFKAFMNIGKKSDGPTKDPEQERKEREMIMGLLNKFTLASNRINPINDNMVT